MDFNKSVYFRQQFFVGNFADGVGDWTVVNDRRLTAEAALDMPIQTVVTRIHLAADEPEKIIDPRGECGTSLYTSQEDL